MIDHRGVWVDEPHAVVRRGIVSTLLAEKIPVIGESHRLAPVPDVDRVSVLIFDAEGPGLRAAVQLFQGRSAQLVALVTAPTDARLHEILQSKVAGVLVRDDLTPELLIGTVRALQQGRTMLPCDVLPRLLAHAAQLSATAPGSLNDRERDVLRMLADGEDTRGIAATLCYSERTVKNVVHDVLTKLNCRTRAQAVAKATRAGVI